MNYSIITAVFRLHNRTQDGDMVLMLCSKPQASTILSEPMSSDTICASVHFTVRVYALNMGMSCIPHYHDGK